MIAADNESARQVGFGLSFVTSETRPLVSVALCRFVIVASLAMFVSKIGLAAFGWFN
jgi:hypothetical protein